MNCDPTLERLPWLLNGTLSEGERREVLDHLAGCAGCRQALDENRLAWEVFDQHLSPAVLVVYAAADETADETASETAGEDGGDDGVRFDRGLVERHLATCPQCAAELELARMSRRLVEDENIAVLPAQRPRQRPGRQVHAPAAAGWRTWRGSAVAAGLAAVVAVSGWIYASRRVHSLEELAARGAVAAASGPQAAAAVEINAVALSLQPRDAVERGARSSQVEEIPASASLATLMLTLPGDKGAGGAASAAYEFGIRDEHGRTVYRGSGLRRDPQLGDLVISLRPRSLAKGTYDLEVKAPGRQARVATYSFRIV
ncbi:MAG TPA: zf-HC2 domain-containing protein [Thermoanaerobaculia bacterium]|nr:zf-HC2 domain-containing protein [Thermoanaerobaculia bacterium]